MFPGHTVAKGMRTVIFFRAEGWYPITLPVGEDLEPHVKCNPGTLRIEDIKGKVLWPKPEAEAARPALAD